LEKLLKKPDAKKYELVDNYRSYANIVEFANQFAKQISHRLKKTPIMPIKKENGNIRICKLASKNITVPVVNAILGIKLSGSTCIVTRANKEVLNIAGMLLKKGISSRQIQTNNDFNLYNLVELRDFIAGVSEDNNSYVITDDLWQQAINNLNKKYANSNNLSNVLKLISDFEETNNNIKYKSDFKQFVRESKLEDFISDPEDSILVSTIHQTKGREFDNIILAFSYFKKMDVETKRGIYVAITRAKQNLYIFYNGDYFDEINVENMQRSVDNKNYPFPDQISLQLSHEDVVLSYFASRKKEIDSLVSGRELSTSDTGCFMENNQVLKFSSKFCDKIKELKETGYSPAKAIIRHIVFWKGKDMENEIKIILPDIEFSKK
jgi:ATP-dependent DNA helicase RecQ